MGKGDLLHPTETAEPLSVHPQTLGLWDRQRKLNLIRLPSHAGGCRVVLQPAVWRSGRAMGLRESARNEGGGEGK